MKFDDRPLLLLWSVKKNLPKSITFHLHKIIVVVCPAFSHGYNESFLKSINLTSKSYKKGDWIGKSLHDEKSIFNKATYNIESGDFCEPKKITKL